MALRLHWFLPSRPKMSGNARPPRPPSRARRLLERLGPTWAASPVRRSVQVVCLVLFLLLFFYICWPYSAQPSARSAGWAPVNVDTVTGEVDVSTEVLPSEPAVPGDVWYVVDDSRQPPKLLGAFRVVRSSGSQWTLAPTNPMGPDALSQLSTSFGPWSLHANPPDRWPSHYADDLSAKQRIPAATFLAFDPLVSLSTALATRRWVWSLGWAAVVLLVCLVIPRGFCGYVCPLGTLIDLFDWAVGRRVSRFRVARADWWSRVKYVLLAAVLAGSLGGVLLTGFVAAIPVLTRGMAFLLAPLQTGLLQGWQEVPPLEPGQYVSIGLFFGVFALGLLGPRFWCRFLCPTGAVFSLGNLLRLHERQVSPACAGCSRCVAACPFDAVQPDFTTQSADCAFCQTCGGLCPANAITFRPRWPVDAQDASGTGSSHSTASQGRSAARSSLRHPALDRRGFLAAGIGAAAGWLGSVGMDSADAVEVGNSQSSKSPLRPPGSIPEDDFVRQCVRCGECLRVCPNGVLRPLGLEYGLTGLWTPRVAADRSGCQASCNRCGQVCPTGAIRALPLEEKRFVRIGRAVVDPTLCLPYVGRSECQWCVQECARTGHKALEFVRIGTETDAAGTPIADTGFLAPVVQPEKCVGCGMCEAICHAMNVRRNPLLTESAIHVEGGEGKEDRLRTGSYRALREAEEAAGNTSRPDPTGDTYLPDFLK